MLSGAQGRVESPGPGDQSYSSRMDFQVKPTSEISKQVSRMKFISDLRSPACSRGQLEGLGDTAARVVPRLALNAPRT